MVSPPMDPTRTRPRSPTLRLLDPIRWVVDDRIDRRLQADVARCAGAIVSGIDFAAIERELVACIASLPSDGACG